jgi:dienelactone hydrolase
MSRRLRMILITLLVLAVLVYLAAPYARATSLIIRVAGIGGGARKVVSLQDTRVEKRPRHMLPTRHGDVPAQIYMPAAVSEHAVLVMPGFNSNGIDEPRLAALANDIAASGYPVMALALPDLQQFRLSPHSTDIIEDAVMWMVNQKSLAPDGRVGIIAVSFSGGLSVVAAGREHIRDRVTFVVSMGGHGDMRRVMRYIATGVAPKVDGLENHAPHDYGVAVILNSLADRGIVPPEQALPLQRAIETYLKASQATVISDAVAAPIFAQARAMGAELSEPSRTYMQYVNDRDVKKLGAVLAEHLNQAGVDDPALSPELAPPPKASIFLLHGHDDNIIPPAESLLLANHLRLKGVRTRVLLSGLITHASVNEHATAMDALKLVNFWAAVIKQ